MIRYMSICGIAVQAVQPSAISNKFVNHDGQRGDDGRYKAFLNDVASVVPKKRVYTDPLHLLAYGSDASFYRLLPKAVIKVHNEQEVQQLLQLSQRHKVPVTFRAAGTSLSGQAITDSVIIRVGYVGKNFRGINIQGDGSKVTAEVGLLGGEVNKLLAAHARCDALRHTGRAMARHSHFMIQPTSLMQRCELQPLDRCNRSRPAGILLHV
eukprot:GHUV01028773.1.p1 GENE.GHUV01028773.1~~GHUV01028773.1.p1  ORF type:complete len:210 (+),score=37.41 GHUV01028773.1:292-921(+)